MIANCLCLVRFDLNFFTVSSILVPWTEEVSGRCPETREGRNPIFSLSSLEPKSLRMIILTIILVQVLCCLYQSSKHYIEIWHERPFSLHRASPGTAGSRPGHAWHGPNSSGFGLANGPRAAWTSIADGLFSRISCGSISCVSFIIWASGVEGDVVWLEGSDADRDPRKKKGDFDVFFEFHRDPFVKREAHVLCFLLI